MFLLSRLVLFPRRLSLSCILLSFDCVNSSRLSPSSGRSRILGSARSLVLFVAAAASRRASCSSSRLSSRSWAFVSWRLVMSSCRLACRLVRSSRPCVSCCSFSWRCGLWWRCVACPFRPSRCGAIRIVICLACIVLVVIVVGYGDA